MPEPLELCVILAAMLPAAAAAASLCAGASGRRGAARRVAAFGALGSCIAACGAVALLTKGTAPAVADVEVYHWLSGAKGFPIDVPFTLHLDRLSAVLLALITLSGALAAFLLRTEDDARLGCR